MRRTFAVGRVDRGTSQVVIVGPVRERRALPEPPSRGLLSGPWSLRALVRAAATALRVVR